MSTNVTPAILLTYKKNLEQRKREIADLRERLIKELAQPPSSSIWPYTVWGYEVAKESLIDYLSTLSDEELDSIVVGVVEFIQTHL